MQMQNLLPFLTPDLPQSFDEKLSRGFDVLKRVENICEVNLWKLRPRCLNQRTPWRCEDLGGGNSNIFFYFHPYLGKISNGLVQPPTSYPLSRHFLGSFLTGARCGAKSSTSWGPAVIPKLPRFHPLGGSEFGHAWIIVDYTAHLYKVYNVAKKGILINQPV